MADIKTKKREVIICTWHPRSEINVNNTVYVAADRLSLNPDLPGIGLPRRLNINKGK